MNFKRLDVNTTVSDRKGLGGIAEGFLRRFKNFAFILYALPIYFVGCVCMGLSMAPGIALISWVYQTFEASPAWIYFPVIGTAVAMAYFSYGILLIFVVAIVNWPIKGMVRPFRGNWYSLQSIPWFIHNGLTYLVRYTFLEFVTPTPLNLLFYRMMGMKLGRGVVINTTNITDPCMITLGNYVTIGGSAHLMAHYGQKGYLILSPVVIGDRVTIGLKASVMGDVKISDGVQVPPHTVLLPKTRL